MNKEKQPEEYKIIRTFVNKKKGTLCCNYKGVWKNE